MYNMDFLSMSLDELAQYSLSAGPSTVDDNGFNVDSVTIGVPNIDRNGFKLQSTARTTTTALLDHDTKIVTVTISDIALNTGLGIEMDVMLYKRAPPSLLYVGINGNRSFIPASTKLRHLYITHMRLITQMYGC